MKTAHEQWLEFAAAIGIGDLNPQSTQYVETRRAFYGGMLAGINSMAEIAGDTPDTPEGEIAATASVETLYQEVKAFYERVAKGIA